MGTSADRSASIADDIRSAFGIEAEVRRPRRLWMDVPPERLLEISGWVKRRGFEHFSAVSVVDRPEEGRFDITYHVWSYNDRVLLTMKTSVGRDDPRIDSLVPVWNESVQVHERELHEAFGVEFVGNPDLSPFFLEEWDGPPPFRKDFDWRSYVRANLFDEENEREKPYFD